MYFQNCKIAFFDDLAQVVFFTNKSETALVRTLQTPTFIVLVFCLSNLMAHLVTEDLQAFCKKWPFLAKKGQIDIFCGLVS